MIIATISAIVIAALLMLMVGVDAEYGPDGLNIRIKIGPKGFTLKSGDGKPGREKKKPDETKEKEAQPKKRFSLPGITRDRIIPILKIILNTLGRLRRKLSFDLIEIRYIAAAPDPASAAMRVGYVNTAIGVLTPLFESAFKIRNREVETGIDFNSEKQYVYVHVVVTLAVWEILYISFSALGEFLDIMYRDR